MKQRIREHIPTIGLVCVWLVLLTSAVGIVRSVAADRSGPNAGPADSSRVAQALACTLRVDQRAQELTGESPFRTSLAGDARRPAPAQPSDASVQASSMRQKLFLKGVLVKGTPLAILEDERGETYIRGVGESVLDQTVLKIHDNRVTMRDRRGSYEISVQE